MSDDAGFMEDVFFAFRTFQAPRPAPPDPTSQIEPEQSVVTRENLTTVADLIAQLQQLPPTMPVLTQDSESGYDTRVETVVEDIELSWHTIGTRLTPNVDYHSSYVDPHPDAKPKPLREGVELVKMLVIG